MKNLNMNGLKNNFIMAPIKLGYCNKDGKVNDRHLNFYEKRSKYIGAIDVEPLYIDAGLRENPFQLGIDNDDKIEGLKKLTRLIHTYDAKAIAHINHPGRMANPNIPGNYYWSSSDKPCESGGAKPVAMDRNMMDKAIQTMVNAAIRAENAGFDFIEIQFGYGYLMSQFLSPVINDRKDEYGGSLDNRMRFPLETLNAIQSHISLPIIARVSADEMSPNGLHIEEVIPFVQALEKAGVVAIHVTAGSICLTPAWFYQHMFVPKGKNWELAAKIKEKISIPIIFHGRINSLKDIEFLKEKYGATYFSVGRAMVADENFVGKILKLCEGNIRPCLACCEGCLGGVREGKGLSCVVNPTVNTNLPSPKPASSTKKIAIIGGGLAGMQAAVTLKERGHEVNLFEKNKLGGQFILAALPPKKEGLQEIINYYKNEIERLKIVVRYEEATAEKLKNEGFDVVIMATGGIPIIPNIKGLKKFYWAEILFDDITPQNKKVLVIGGGLIGIEITSKLLDKGNKVIIVEMLDEIARGLEMIEKNMLLKEIKDARVEILLKHQVKEVKDNKVILLSGDKETVLENIDAIVLATGMKSYIPFHSTLPTYYVGDAKEVHKAQEAIRSAYEVGLNI
ncbi:MAG: FAD-dependent oxidoreductase [bacterium]